MYWDLRNQICDRVSDLGRSIERCWNGSPSSSNSYSSSSSTTSSSTEITIRKTKTTNTDDTLRNFAKRSIGK
jgi:hypothetical protein